MLDVNARGRIVLFMKREDIVEDTAVCLKQSHVSHATPGCSTTLSMMNLLFELFDHFLHEASETTLRRGLAARLSIVKHVTGILMTLC